MNIINEEPKRVQDVLPSLLVRTGILRRTLCDHVFNIAVFLPLMA